MKKTILSFLIIFSACKSKEEKIFDMMKDDLNTMTRLSNHYSSGWDNDGDEFIRKSIDSVQKHMDSLGVELTKY